MKGSIHIEVLNESAVIVATHLKGVSEIDKQTLIMTLAEALHLTPVDFLTISLSYPEFLATAKHAKTYLSNNRSTPD